MFMNQFIKTGVPVLSLFFLAACGGGNQSAPADSTKQQPAVQAHSAPSVQLKDDNLNAVYPHYVLLSAALTSGDVTAARKAANAIGTGAATMADGAALAKTANSITTSTDIAIQRTAFAALSNELITLIKKSGLSSGQLYVDFCPMAMQDKGAYWVSNNKEIKNPYFGDQMLTCGEVKETIQ